jgi:uncharacterized RDD family membrane protein YckC
MSAPLDTDVAIETPEHIVFHYRVAGPARRAVAYLLDLLLCYGVIALVTVLVLLALVGTSFVHGELPAAAGAAGGLVLLLLFATQWVYFVVWEGALGRSPGKMALGLRVVSTAGRPIGYRAAALRNLLRAADALPTAYVLGVSWMAVSSRFQRLGDTVAGTMVVVPERTFSSRAIELSPPAEPRELATLPEHVSLDADERTAIELFLRRRYTLGRERAAELAETIAGPLGARIGYHHADATRMLALVYDRAVNEGRTEAPPSSWRPRVRQREGGAS